MRVRIKFRKEAEGRFISHLDLLRVVERAVRRAGLKVAHTQGFNPRPRILYASALALGATSEAEYADIDLEVAVPAADVPRRLNSVLPPAVRVTAAAEVSPRAKPLMAVVNAAEYDVLVPVTAAPNAPNAPNALNAPNAADAADAAAPDRAAVEAAARGVAARGPAAGVFALEVAGFCPPLLKLRVVLRLGGAGTVRPAAVAAEVCAAAGLLAGVPCLHRRGLYAARGDELLTPWQLG
jgi:radical SAM-linked protein